MMKQGLELQKRPHIVIGTPGRLADHLRSNDTLKLNRCLLFVSCFFPGQQTVATWLTFTPGTVLAFWCWTRLTGCCRTIRCKTISSSLFRFQLCKFVSFGVMVGYQALPAARQTLLFSATMPKSLEGPIAQVRKAYFA